MSRFRVLVEEVVPGSNTSWKRVHEIEIDTKSKTTALAESLRRAMNQGDK